MSSGCKVLPKLLLNQCHLSLVTHCGIWQRTNFIWNINISIMNICLKNKQLKFYKRFSYKQVSFIHCSKIQPVSRSGWRDGGWNTWMQAIYMYATSKILKYISVRTGQICGPDNNKSTVHGFSTTNITQIINLLWPRDAIWRNMSGSTLDQVMAWCLTAPSHYLNQCWLIICYVMWHSPDGNIHGKCW